MALLAELFLWMDSVWLYGLLNTGCCAGYFTTHRVGWYDRFEPAMMFVVFAAAGVVWTMVVIMLNLWGGHYAKRS